MPPLAGAIFGFYLSWRISAVCLGPWHFIVALFITHFSSNWFWFVRLSLCLCVCYILWQLPFCVLSMEHFPHNWVFPCGPHARLERHETTRHDRSVLCVVRNFLALPGEQPAVTSAASLPNTAGCCAVLRPRLPFGRQTGYALSRSISVSIFLYRTLSLSMFWQLPGRASSSA